MEGVKLPAIHDNLPGFFFFLWPFAAIPEAKVDIFIPKAMGSTHENNAFMDHFGECIFGKFSSSTHPVINVVSKHVGEMKCTVNEEGNFSVQDENL